MDAKCYQTYLEILHEELVPALGCTEPIAIAYASAYAEEVLGEFPVHMDIFCSGNIVKNVKSVTVPNSGGLKGIETAAILGAVGGDAHKKLEVLEGVTDEHRKLTKELLEGDFCTCHLQKGAANLYIRAELQGKEHSSLVVIEDSHTNIVLVRKDGQTLFEAAKTGGTPEEKTEKRDLLSIEKILEFADSVSMEDIEEVIGRQVDMNTEISDEGLKHPYGAQVGRTILKAYGGDVKERARARAAAGSDARMNGCSMPVIINSGSGNQGMTCSLPVIEYAKEWKVSREKMYRALVVSNLVAIHQKKYIGSLSAYCGAVSAACGAGAAITWMHGGDYDAVCRTITNTIANMGGVVCDGAKSSCAAKIASAVDAAILAYSLERENRCFQPGEGLVRSDVEGTIKSMGYVGRVGMKETDETILNLMLQKDV
ncbi:hypothetical protein BRYFOR_05083 [Marvinbryantia formatexigens DSM 14469]|uniref:UPF0597 protein BRYFOR_05083 n=1 Tax=Marvinbryantia formatexigens DSM 14469 TaxID=478749 RepID=C6L8Z4_9FIRM|nr:L-serine ammonia-lyase, iron-sulfur-dependent, subunit alpha [Marvinbryantia formatexigens]EET62733.1 hypothetical protein BRYFOR_05083 [Marvinbryantia formatexigens DSM 14469]UWO23101.1 L-serine ammonia-lyase, iron-sulfur-dependent, subunit alpha [Marvinbryantia formatexigens DSM 14469]SDF99397.1 L-cysteine desulfidase [Marvinbryantia formatexigens]